MKYKQIKKIVPYISLAISLLFMVITLRTILPYASWINIVKGNSMYPTLEDGQITFPNMVDGFSRGDIVTSYFPEHMEDDDPEYKDELIVKRIVGLPGERIVINKCGVIINGEKLEEEYLSKEAVNQGVSDNEIVYELGDNEYFLMGDNRKVSLDSRVFGAVTSDRIMYKQSEVPTVNFWGRLMLVVVIMFGTLVLYACVNVLLLYLVRLHRGKCHVFIEKKCKTQI